MKVSCDREALLKAVQGASGPTSGKVPMGLLRNVLFVANGAEGGSEVVGTNNEIGIRQRVSGVHVDEPGRILLNAERTAKILRAIGSSEVALVADSNEVTFTGNGSEFSMPLDNVDAFPDVETGEGIDVDFEVPGNVLKQAIAQTVFATDDERAAQVFAGVCFGTSKGHTEKLWRAVSTDGNCMAHRPLPATATNGRADVQAIVPAKSLIELARLIGTDETVNVTFPGESMAVFSSGPMLFTTRLVAGRFPPWWQSFPKGEPRQTVEFPVADLAAAVESAAIMASEFSKGIVWEFKGGVLSLSIQSVDTGRSCVTLPCDTSLFGHSRFILNSDYVVPALKAADKSGTVSLRIYGPADGVLFECNGWEYLLATINEEAINGGKK